MNAHLRFTLALTLAIAIPIAALADQHRGSSGGGGSRASASRAPASHAAPARSAPSRSTPQNRGGFNLNRDVAPQRPTAQVQQRSQQQRGAPGIERSNGRGNTGRGNTGRAPAGNNNRAVYNRSGNGPYTGQFHGSRIGNPRYNGGAWGWNRGMAWNASPGYWGGGFWGAFAIASLADALIYGSIIDSQDQEIYPSYEVTPDSPGAEMLQNYGLQQTQCGPPNLVVIWGPDNSVICTYPNNLVAPGNYELDPSTLTIVAQQ